MPLRAVLVLALLAACSGAGGPTFRDAAPDEPVPAGPDEPFATPIPDTIYARVTFDTCAHRGRTMAVGEADTHGDCTICQCTTYGPRCARRASCPRDVCVFADGTEAAPGDTVRVRGCFECTCDDAGGTCRPDPHPDCPQDGCVLPAAPGADPGAVIPLGATDRVSECHECTCAPDVGLWCWDFCHPQCTLRDEELQVIGTVDDQTRVPTDDGCGTCVCDYYDLVCDRRSCS